MRNTSRVVSIKLPARLEKRIDQLARAKKITRSELIRSALERLDDGGNNLSFLSQAEDLVGIVDAPRDLSTSARHMRDFGK